MPNWCSNTLTLTHEDPAQIQRAVDAFNAGKLFQEFLPCPEALLDGTAPADGAAAAANIEKYGASDWYQWCVDNWGTKWDANTDGYEAIADEDGKSVVLSFSTAWGPPIEWYDNIEGFHITAYYYEPGMGFCGKWTSEAGDEHHEYSTDDDIDELRERIPEDILEQFGIIDEISYYQEEMQDDWLDDESSDEEDEENSDIDLDGGLSAINEGHEDEQEADGDHEK